jgi:hypothetical protein
MSKAALGCRGARALDIEEQSKGDHRRCDDEACAQSENHHASSLYDCIVNISIPKLDNETCPKLEQTDQCNPQ